ncbi:MAG: ABC transporter ATP-binding protein, partial [Lachnospira sp.]|nr:ABC transporter ATP-binding protein [Lachnospira sp.]
MDQQRIERIKKKYSTYKADNAKKEMNIGRMAGRGMAMSAKGKPKNMAKTIGRLVKYLVYERKLLLVAITFAVVYTLASLAVSYMLRPIINEFIYYDPNDLDVTPRMMSLIAALGVLAVVYVIEVASQWLQHRIMLTVSQRALKRMRQDLFDKLQTLPIKYFDNNSTGDIMSRFTNDVDTIGEMLNTTLIKIVSGAITIVGTVILMLYTNFILGGITLIMAPILTWVSK